MAKHRNDNIKTIDNKIDGVLWYIFVAYVICCVLFMVLFYNIGHGGTISLAIWYFIYLLFPPLLVYVMVKTLIDIFQGIQVWKILNLCFLIIFTYCFYFAFEADILYYYIFKA